MNLAFDILLGMALLATAVGLFSSVNLFRAVVMFIAFGLLLALVWVRLDAPDLALAEAAIGAGLTGVLMIDAVAHMRSHEDTSPRYPIWLPLLACVLVSILLLTAVWQRPDATISLAQEVAMALPDSGVEHPITAVLLNFRSYDTLLEIAVLLVAIVVAMALKTEQPAKARQTAPSQESILEGLSSRLVPVMLLVGVYLLWAGSYQPGGAFQGGAILASALVFLQLSGVNMERYADSLLRLGLALGFLIFLTVATSTMIGGQPFLTYPEGFAGELIFLIETALTFSIGLILFSLFSQAPGHSVTSAHVANEKHQGGNDG